jgi:hypothetical protein
MSGPRDYLVKTPVELDGLQSLLTATAREGWKLVTVLPHEDMYATVWERKKPKSKQKDQAKEH